MNVIMGLTNLLGATVPLTPRQDEFVHTLQTSARSLLGLINDLLDIAKIESHSVEFERIPFDVGELSKEVAGMMAVAAREKRLSFDVAVECPVEAGRIFVGDPARIRQVLVNLCSNAVKFTEQGGVTLSIACEASPSDEADNVVFNIKDTGIGIASEKLDAIFSKFMQADSSISRKYGGTGLGLAISKNLVELMGGTVRVQSELGGGSLFTVSLPLHRASTKRPDRSAAEQDVLSPPSRPDARVLLVEDHPANILVATAFLDQFGLLYDVADTGAQAIEKVKSSALYGAVLMDIQMPGMDGYEATRRIRDWEKQKGVHVPIIGITAYAMSGDRERCIAAGMDDYIAKPFNPDELKRKLHAAMA